MKDKNVIKGLRISHSGKNEDPYYFKKVIFLMKKTGFH